MRAMHRTYYGASQNEQRLEASAPREAEDDAGQDEASYLEEFESETGASSAGPGGQHRGFGRGQFGHSRHRNEPDEMGRSSVYGQPVREGDPYPGRPVEREGGQMGASERSHRGPKGYRRSDERIQEFICERLVRHPWLEVGEVSVTVKDGRVSLEGSVPERRMKHEIEDVADGCWGVREVDNRLQVLRQEAPEAAREGSPEPGEWAGSARAASAAAMRASPFTALARRGSARPASARER